MKVILDANRSTEPYGFLLGEPGREVAEEKEIEREQVQEIRKRRRPNSSQNTRKKSRPRNPQEASEPNAVSDRPAPNVLATLEEGTLKNEDGSEARKRRRPSRRRKKPNAPNETEAPKNSADQDS
ncbi:hypothetical protein [Salmonirosea aquatica]|uniref:hypothetical protein n=1 Tax=Salmonirosea aquatica TaxID=2654236 RepID=UPI0035716B47